MQDPETKDHFVEFDLDVNLWAQDPPGVRVARPPVCVKCEAPGVGASGRIVLHGHGLRLRSPRGPSEAEGAPRVVELLLRRYECQRCAAVLTVGPRGLLPWRRYSAQAIGLALFLWGLLGQTDPAVRERTSPAENRGLSRPERWTTLRRWARAIRDGALWPGISVDRSWTLRECAERVARGLRARGALDSGGDEARVFHGAALAR